MTVTVAILVWAVITALLVAGRVVDARLIDAQRDALRRQLAALNDGYTSLQVEFQLLRDLVEINHPDLFARYLAGELAFEAR